MKEKIFLDADVILDTLLQRKPHCRYSQEIFVLVETNQVTGCTSCLVIANLYYLLRKLSSHKRAVSAIQKLRSLLTILPFGDKEIGESVNAGFKDFEDGIQYFIALNNGIDMLITRNTKDFRKFKLTAMTPEEYIGLRGSGRPEAT